MPAPVELIIATFQEDEERAGQVLEGAKRLEKEGTLVLRHGAVIRKTQGGEIDVKDLGDVDKKHGRVFGAITGGLIGLLGGPVGVVVGATAGAVTGGFVADNADYGVSDHVIEAVKRDLESGGSAIIAYVEMDGVDVAVTSLEKEGAIVYHETIQRDASDRTITNLSSLPGI